MKKTFSLNKLKFNFSSIFSFTKASFHNKYLLTTSKYLNNNNYKLQPGLLNSNSLYNSLTKRYFSVKEALQKQQNNEQLQLDISKEELKTQDNKEISEVNYFPEILSLTKDHYEWSHKYFSPDQQLTLPVISLRTLLYTSKNITLPHEFFNAIIRKDIIYRVYKYNTDYNRISLKRTKSKGMVAGSGKKPMRQKGNGRARQGNKRSPLMKKGGHAFAIKPRSYYFSLNKKIRLQGLKCMLTAKLVEKQIIVLDEVMIQKKLNDEQVRVEELLSGRKSTKNNSTRVKSNEKTEIEIIKSFLNGNRAVIYASDDLEKKILEDNIKKDKSISICAKKFTEINVKALVENNYLIFSVKTLKDFITKLQKRDDNYNRVTRKFKNINTLKQTESSKLKFSFDPFSKLDLATPALQGSYKNILEGAIVPEHIENKHFRNAEKKNEEKKNKFFLKQSILDKMDKKERGGKYEEHKKTIRKLREQKRIEENKYK